MEHKMIPLCGPEFSEQPEFSGGVTEKNLRVFHLQITVLFKCVTTSLWYNYYFQVYIFNISIVGLLSVAGVLAVDGNPTAADVHAVTGVYGFAIVPAAAGTYSVSFVVGPPCYWRPVFVHDVAGINTVAGVSTVVGPTVIVYRRPYALALVHGLNMGFLQREWAIFLHVWIDLGLKKSRWLFQEAPLILH